VTVPEPHRTAPSGDPVLVVACREFVELVTEHLDGSLPDELEQAIAAHLELCGPCVEYLDQMRGTIALLGSMPTQTLPPAAKTRLLDVYHQLHATPRS
jgi:hypothetical protein